MSRTQLEMYRRLMYVGVPDRISSLIAGSIFDRERSPRFSPAPSIGEVEAFETTRDWLDDHLGQAVLRDEVEELLTELFGPDQTVYQWAELGIRTEKSRDGLPDDPATAAMVIIKTALEASRASFVSELPESTTIADTGMVEEFEAGLRSLLAISIVPPFELPQQATDDHDRNLHLLIYEKAWSVLERIDPEAPASTRDRLTVVGFFEVLWGWLQAYSPAVRARKPIEAFPVVFPAESRCIRCGLKAANSSVSGAPSERYVTGLCSHEYITEEDRLELWTRRPDHLDDLAQRLLHVAHDHLDVAVEATRYDASFPEVEPKIRARFLTAVQDSIGVRLDSEDLQRVNSLGDLLTLFIGELDPFPTSPFAGERVAHLFANIGTPPSADVKRSSSGSHLPRAACLGGELLKHFDDPDVAQGKFATYLNLIAQGRCSRCTQKLGPSPTGSRATRCRCVPICYECDSEEESIGVRLAEWPGGERGFAGPRDQEELVAAAFNVWAVSEPSETPADDSSRQRWSYSSWPHRIFGQLPADGLLRMRRVGRSRLIGDAGVADVRRRVLGCFLGGAVGDALGGRVEFMSLDEIRQLMGPRGVQGYWDKPPYAFTDDTQMTLWTAEGLIRTRQRWHGSDYNWWSPLNVTSHAYYRWLLTQGFDASSDHQSLEPEYLRTGWLLAVPELWVRMAPGNTCLRALRSGEIGTVEQPINDSKGCGGVMRVAPAGFVPSDDYAFELGSGLAAITHGHPSGYLAAGALAHIISFLKDGSLLKDAVESALELLKDEPKGGECAIALENAVELARKAKPSSEKLESLGRGWVAEEALAIAVYCSMVADDFRSGVLLAVNHSGDSDSTGSIAGQILGTMLGVETIPQEWLDELQMGSVVERVAHDLVDVFYGEKVLVNDLYPAW